MLRLLRRVALLLTASLFALPAHAQADEVVSALLPYVPENANMLAVIRVRRLLDSPRGQRENWRARQGADFLAGSISVGTLLDTIVRGAQVTPAAPGGTWAVGLALRPMGLALDTVARAVKGRTEQIAGKSIVASSHGYFAELTSDVMGVMSANAPRQDFARWVRRSETPSRPQLSSYLTTAAADDSADILVAVDTLDAPNPPVLRERLAASPVLKGRTDDQRALYHLLVGLRGFRLAITVSENTSATMTFDFSTPTTPQAALLKPILIELLEDAGAAIDELRDAQVSLGPQAAVLRFTLTDAGLRRVMSLIPLPTMSYAQPGPASAGSSKVSDLTASRKYYREVNRLLADLQRANRTAKDYQKTATWHDSFARRIEQLPVVGVDPELLDYGAGVAQKLHMLAASLRGTKVDLAALDAGTKYNVNVSPFYGPAGVFTVGNTYVPAPWEVSSNLAEVRARQAEAVAQGAGQRDQIWQSLNAAKVQIRNRMAEKYQVDFDRPGK